MNLSILVAKSENNIIGNDNRLVWHLPADLRHFRELTTGGTVIMGRKTYESIGKPLPNRDNIVITRQKDYAAAGCQVAGSLDEAVQLSGHDENVFIIGGGEIYRQAMEIAGTLYITEVHGEFQGDTSFPEIDRDVWEETFREDHASNEKNPFDFSFVTYQRKNN